MGQELELDLNDKLSVGLSPNTVLSSQQYSLNVKKRSKKEKHTRKDDFSNLKGDFIDIKFARLRSASCKSHLSKPHGLEGNTEMRRSSLYHSSEEVKKINKMASIGGRQKIEISRSSDTSFAGSVVDSLCGSDDENFGQRSSDLDSPFVSSSWACLESNSPNSFIEFCINSDDRDKNSTAVEGRDYINLKFRSDKVSDSPLNEKDTVHSLQKSVSAKVEAPHLQSPFENDCSLRTSSKVQFNPVRRKLTQLTKSKSLRSPLSRMPETNEVKSNEKAYITRNRTYQKSLLNDLSNSAKHSDIISEFINREIQYSGIASSPVHLHGNLKVENKHGVPFFEFKVKCPEDVFVAKTWRTGSSLNWVYTFHSIDTRKKSSSSATGLESQNLDQDSSIVAQMLVSCKLCSELDSRVVDNCMVTEFVLYDFTHTRQSVSLEKKPFCESDASKTLRQDEENVAIRNKIQEKPISSNVKFDKSNSYPLLSSYSSMETAAIVLQIPFSKRESLKYKRGDRKSAKEYSNIIDLSATVDQSRKSLHDSKILEQVKVVIPTGNHGLPTAESEGPSSLLERWRHGGGCDCGGWDMACPLILLGNPTIQFAEDSPLMEDYQPLELFIQGAKESSPTFSMTLVEEGLYNVDFHAQLSTLQAFSICVAILHGTSSFSGAAHEKNNQRLSQCSSLKMLIEEDMDIFIESVTTKERKTVSKTQKGIPRSYMLNPPFSPIARV